MLKKDARKIYQQKRVAIGMAEKEKWDDLMLIQFQSMELPFLHTVFSYRSQEEKNEPVTDLITAFLEFRNPALKIAYPKIIAGSNHMEAILANADTAFRKNIFDIEEPVADQPVSPLNIDLVLVPLLICDQSGYRVGYGKGFYDRYLSQCRGDCIKAGLMYFEPVDEITDRHEFDIPLDICITPHNTYVF